MRTARLWKDPRTGIWKLRRRIPGRYRGVAGRRGDVIKIHGFSAVFEDVESANITVPLAVFGDLVHREKIGELDTRGSAFLWGVDFGIDHPFAAVLLSHDSDNDIIYVLAELKVKGAIPAIHASRMRVIAGSVPIAWPHDGNARDKGSGETLASIYAREGPAMLGQHASLSTGGYSAEAGIIEMLTRMRDGRFKVAAHLREWQEEMESYDRIDGLIIKVNDDLLSATRIGVMQLRSARPAVLGPVRPDVRQRPGREEFAIGHDADPFGV